MGDQNTAVKNVEPGSVNTINGNINVKNVEKDCVSMENGKIVAKNVKIIVWVIQLKPVALEVQITQVREERSLKTSLTKK